MKNILLTIIIFFLAVSVYAANEWTGSGGNNLWTNTSNWTLGYPDSSNQLKIQGDGEILEVIDGDEITVSRMLFMDGSAYNNTLTTVNYTGGSFICNGYWYVAGSITSDYDKGCEINLSGDAYVQTASMALGYGTPSGSSISVARLNITDNARMYVTIEGSTTYRQSGFVIPGDTGDDIMVRVNIDERGVLEVNNLVMGSGEDVSINIEDNATLKVKGDLRDEVSDLISSGLILTDSGTQTPVISYDGYWTIVCSPNNTDIWAVSSPSPSENSSSYTITELSWQPGATGRTWNVYLGTSADDLAIAAAGTAVPELRLTNLDFDTDYYWRVDELKESTIVEGDVWTFYVRDYLKIFWFEYLDQASLDSDWIADNVQLSPCSNPARGSASMSITYDNSSSPYLGSATSISCPFNGDFLCSGATKMSVWIYGDSVNSNEYIYATLDDGEQQAKLVCPISNVTLTESWQIWYIQFSDVVTANSNINLNSIDTIQIGVGNPSNPSAGGSGTIYIDNINLFP